MSDIINLQKFPDLSQQLRTRISETENEDDVIALIELLAFDRALARREQPEYTHFVFAGRMLCVILDPIKPPEFVDAATQYRKGFVGVASSRQSQLQFIRSVTPFLLVVDNERDAYKAGFHKLFSETEREISAG
jgi:hypothetical protein